MFGVDLNDQVCDQLRAAFLAAGYSTDGTLAVLGPQAHAALGRGELEPAARAVRDAGALGTLVRLFLLAEPVPEREAAAALRPLTVADAVRAGLLRTDGEVVRAALDVRPYGDEQGSWWVISDLDADARGGAVPTDHVLGVGHASLSLARATARRPVGTLLDLGTGCGVQSLHASRHAEQITATDLSGRALALASATFRLNQIDVETTRGEWFAPVAGRRFQQVVCNPPFVVGPPRVDYVYRDSGLSGDGASELVVRQIPGHLADGGVGQLLASWLHVKGQDWEERVSSWLPAEGLDAWFVQRDVADPALYVGTWLRDAGVDPRSPEGRERAGRWLDWFAENDVEGIGFGFVTLRHTQQGPADVVCEDLRQAYDDPLGPETAAWLDRVAWLRQHGSDAALLDARLTVPDQVVLEEVFSPAEEGWEELVRRLHRQDGPGWQHDLDDLSAALLSGARGHLPLSDLLGLLSAGHGVPYDLLVMGALPAVRNLVKHGMLVPADWVVA
ncbi:methylase of polypeptide subunit release factors [Crossiella equi]|uniref:Methylase of polypeptide subunit release factors n=1 Tax=Crossiella equi TaxID=130796 RepID=A0ABS5AAF3_9PSEU|nr:methyltransferase [Crossiella equi]MBP2473563.1 methylase of polypeptide subunit release factors [Crossiella equi]